MAWAVPWKKQEMALPMWRRLWIAFLKCCESILWPAPWNGFDDTTGFSIRTFCSKGWMICFFLTTILIISLKCYLLHLDEAIQGIVCRQPVKKICASPLSCFIWEALKKENVCIDYEGYSFFQGPIRVKIKTALPGHLYIVAVSAWHPLSCTLLSEGLCFQPVLQLAVLPAREAPCFPCCHS